MEINKLPNGWEIKRIEEIAQVNPQREKIKVDDNTFINFIPMAAVKEEFGGIDISNMRTFEKVKKGYTQFRSGDVLIAKITPCMENGKVALIPTLENDFGYGSTEFHVLRPKNNISSKWLAYYVVQHSFRKEARLNMKGSAGQLRVPTKWVSKQKIPVPSYDQQKRIVAKIEELFSYLDAGVAALERAQANLKRYRAAVLKAAVEGKLTEEWRKQNPDVEPASELLKHILAERKTKWIERELHKWILKKVSKRKNPSWYVYAVRSDDDSIYIGHTDDVGKRWNEHVRDKGNAGTNGKRPVAIVYCEEYDSREKAVERKKWLTSERGRTWLEQWLKNPAKHKTPDETKGLHVQLLFQAGKITQKYKEPQPPDTTNLPNLPDGWCWVNFDQVLVLIRNGTTASQNKDGKGIAVSRIETISMSKIDFERVRHIAEVSDELQNSYILKPGDILFSHINSPSHLGKTGLYMEDMPPLIHGMNLLMLRPIRYSYLSEFINLICVHLRNSGDFSAIAHHAVNQASINQDRLRQVVFPLPPSSEQCEIVKTVEEKITLVDHQLSDIDCNIEKLYRLRQSILKHMFNGKLLRE